MTEWVVNGNKPKGYEGKLTEKQQRWVDQAVAEQELKKYVPERCRGCRALSLYTLTDLSYDLVVNGVPKEEAIQRLQSYTAGCTGVQVDNTMYDAPDICPIDTHDDRNRKPGLY